MKPSSAILSAAAPAIIRVIESYRSEKERLFDDRFANGLLPALFRVISDLLRVPLLGTAVLAVRERQWPGLMGNIICRTCYIDDVLRDALGEGLDQVVILGAGLDSRAYRIPSIDRTRVFEVDHPATQDWKKARLQKILGTLPSYVNFVPIDFEQQKLEDAMAAAGFHTGAKTFFIWEGVTQYITAEAVDATFRYISRAAVTGNQIVFTYIRRGIVDGSTRSDVDQKIVSTAQRQGMPWIFGLDPTELAHYLALRGLKLVKDAGAPEYQVRYLDPISRKMNVWEGERIALAHTAGTLSESSPM